MNTEVVTGLYKLHLVVTAIRYTRRSSRQATHLVIR